MDADKRGRLVRAGWKVGDASGFLDLAPEEAAYVELKISLARSLKNERLRQGLTQTQMAQRIGSSQSRVAKMENGDPTVSLDLLIRALFGLGRDRSQLVDLLGA